MACCPAPSSSSAYRISFGSTALEPGSEHLGRLAVEQRRGGPLGVELVLLQALFERRHVAVVDARGEQQPQPDRRQRDQAQVLGPQAPQRREREHHQPGEPVAGAPRDRVDEGLRGQLDRRRYRQVEQLHRRPVDRVAQHLVDTLEQHRRPERREGEQPRRAREQPEREQEQHRPEPQSPQRAGRDQELRRHAQHADPGVEAAEERGHRVLAHERLLRDRLELPARDGGDERRQHDDHGDRPQVRGAQHQAQAGAQAHPVGGRSPGGVAQGSGPAAPKRRHERRGDEQQGGRHHEQALGAEAARESAREEAADGGPERRASAHEPEHATRLARGEHVVGERPHLRRSEDAQHADPDVDDGVEPGRRRPASERGERQPHGSEGRQAPRDQTVERQPATDAHVERHHHGHHQEQRHVGERQQRRVEATEEERVARDLADQVRADHQEQVDEEQQPAGEIPPLQPQKPLQGAGHRGSAGIKPEPEAGVHSRQLAPRKDGP